VRRYYDKNKNKKKYEKEFMLPGKVHLLHIAVKSETEAEKIKAELNKGADFSKLARKYSIHKTAAEKGGDLGWVRYDRMRHLGPDIAEAAKELPSGSVSEPVRYRRAYHIIKVLERKPPSHRPIEDMKINIRNTLLRKKQQKTMKAVIEELEATLPVRILDEAGDAGKR
ncbi:MAG: peptidylprolyl isomerase, partial [Deltaproteobacteria bacterium]|nr:peptidylprolyl isomerase [Deltaproteobacteria bacterium]